MISTKLISQGCMALFLILLPGCEGSMSGNEAMERRLDEAARELDRHHAAVMDAGSLPEIGEEATTHDENMERIMDDMGGAMDMMSHCSGAGMSEMHDMMTGMKAEMLEHSTALRAAGDLGSAQGLCESHATEMRAMISDGHDALGGMGCQGMMR
jgi:hypothetical protein